MNKIERAKRIERINTVIDKVLDVLEEEQVDVDLVAAIAANLLSRCLVYCDSEAQVDALMGKVTTTAFEGATQELKRHFQ